MDLQIQAALSVPTVDKPLFGAYLNMARNNLRMVLEHVDERVHNQKRFIEEDRMQECDLIKSLLSNTQPDVAKKIIEMLKQHLPFLKLIVESKQNVSPHQYAAALINIIEHLNEYRNFHSHYLHQPYHTKTDTIETMRFIFDAARRKVKIRFALEDADVKHLVRKTAVKVDGKKTTEEKKNYPFAFARENGEITEKGLAFFICLLLEKKYVILFLKQLRGFKDSRTKATRATLETFSFYSIRVPQPKLVSNDTKEGLLLDILEELKRCPGELFDLLSTNDQERFRRIPENGADAEAEVLQKRYGDRFPYLALRYLELTHGIKDTQFHTDLGKYNFKSYKKQVGGEERIRQLQKHMKGMGRLKDFAEDKMPQEWNALVKRSDELPEGFMEPHIVYTVPHYHFVNNQIGISITEEVVYPDINGRKNKEPDIWLSIYELPALLFLHLLTRKNDNSSDAKWVLFLHNQNIKKFFKAIVNQELVPGFSKEELSTELKKYKLELSYIPKALIEYLLQKPVPDVQAKAEKKLQTFIEETNYLIRRIEDDLIRAQEKPGSKRYKPIQSGKIADFLARDMLLFQPPVKTLKGKANSTLFQVLQARLAYYGRDRNLLTDLYKECNLIDSENPHPFLKDLPIVNNIIDYYKNYLQRRTAYLEKLLVKCIQGKINSRDFHFLHLGEREKRNGNAYYINLAKEFLNKPMNFPRGLFMDAIKNHFIKKGHESLKKIIEEKERTNTVFLLQEYMKAVLDDETQPFYQWKRNYFFIEQLYDTRKKESRESRKKIFLSPNELTTKTTEIKNRIAQLPETTEEQKVAKIIAEKNYHHFTENEKLIRHIKACDIMLFLLVKDLIHDLESDFFKGVDMQKIKLKDVLPDAEQGILSARITVKLPCEDKFICQENLKLKNYGDFRRFLKEKRLKNLVKYFSQKEIERNKLEKELEKYDKARVEILRLLIAFEKEVAMKCNIDFTSNPGYHYVSNEIILDAWKSITSDTKNREKMQWLRNKFLHNEYPDYGMFKDDIDVSKSSIAEQFIEKAKEYFSV